MKRTMMAMTLGGWVLGWLVAGQLSDALSFPPTAAAAPAPRPSTTALGLLEYRTALLSRDLFGTTGTEATTTTRLSIDASLLATVVSPDPMRSSALIRLGSSTDSYGLGDSLSDGVSVLSITPRQVVLTVNRRQQTLTMDDMKRADEPIGPEATGAATLKRAEVDAMLSGGTGAMRVIPHKDEGGEIDGYRLSGIRRSTALHRVGVRNGDVVHAINGHTITSMEAALLAHRELEGEDAFTIDITRRGSRQALSVVIE